MSSFPITYRTRVRRLAERGSYDRETVYSILDEAFICHVGFVSEAKPVVLPTLYGRDGDRLYIHGSAANRMLRDISKGVDMCITVSLVDGIVLARSAFHMSVNYRSVVVHGRATAVEGGEEKARALKILSEHVIPGRWAEVREPSEKELKATAVMSIDLKEVSAKVRTGGPKDDADDMRRPTWAGVLPLEMQFGDLLPDELMVAGIAIPEYLKVSSPKKRK
jgi:nitroimidazol reductase NimA-like FMN-containing flavoprotein (pyridoxamine 5'-phosphate oxidase superfamily)